MNKNVIRIISLILAGLMFIGVFISVIMNSYAMPSCLTVLPPNGEHSKVLPAVIIFIGIMAAAIAGIVVPKIKNKKE